MDAIDVDVDLLAESTQDLVRYRLANAHGEAVAVRIKQPILSGVSQSQVAIDAEYETGPWRTEGDSLVFIRKLEAGEAVETGYTLGGVDTSTILELLREVTIEVRNLEGVELGYLEGSELRVGGRKSGTDGQSDQPGRTDLPASVSDYVLQDVGEVDSAEFEWTPVDEEPSGGLLGRLFSFL